MSEDETIASTEMKMTTKCVLTPSQEYRALRKLLCEVNTHVYLQLLEKLFQSIVRSKKDEQTFKIPSQSDLLRRRIPRPEIHDKIQPKYAEESYKLFDKDRKPGITLKSTSYRQKSSLICL